MHPVEAPELFLTDRQLEVLWHFGDGQSNKAISRILHITENTVKEHRKNIKRRLKGPNVKRIASRYREEHDKPPIKQRRDKLN
jgi:DNA-binding CsgD family transcriptional regulator